MSFHSWFLKIPANCVLSGFRFIRLSEKKITIALQFPLFGNIKNGIEFWETMNIKIWQRLNKFLLKNHDTTVAFNLELFWILKSSDRCNSSTEEGISNNTESNQSSKFKFTTCQNKIKSIKLKWFKRRVLVLI